MDDLVRNTVIPITVDSKFAEEWDFELLNKNLTRITDRFTGISYTPEQIQDLTAEQLEEDVINVFRGLYDAKEAEIGTEHMREVEKMILLRVVDNHWMDHIDAMDDLKKGIGLRSVGQMDPAAAYANEGFDMFEEMIGDIREKTVSHCFNVTVRTGVERKRVIGSGEGRKDEYKAAQPQQAQPAQSAQMPAAAPKPQEARKPETFRRDMPKVGRNDLCPCGSGKKYKNCCMNKTEE